MLKSLISLLTLFWITLLPTIAQDQKVNLNFDISEVGLLRLLTVVNDKTPGSEPTLKEALTNADFRVFELNKSVSGSPSAEQLSKLGKKSFADLVIYSETTLKKKAMLHDFYNYQATTTIKVYSPTSKELLTSQTEKAKGVTHVDEDEAKESARDRSIQAAMSDVLKELKAKAHRLMVYQFSMKGITNMTDLNYVTAHMEKMANVYQVRKKSFDRKTGIALVEVLAHPSTTDKWQVHLELMPRRVTKVTVIKRNKKLRKKYPNWFKPTGEVKTNAPSFIKKQSK